MKSTNLKTYFEVLGKANARLFLVENKEDIILHYLNNDIYFLLNNIIENLAVLSDSELNEEQTKLLELLKTAVNNLQDFINELVSSFLEMEQVTAPAWQN
jgi:hypothetical protein